MLLAISEEFVSLIFKDGSNNVDPVGLPFAPIEYHHQISRLCDSDQPSDTTVLYQRFRSRFIPRLGIPIPLLFPRSEKCGEPFPDAGLQWCSPGRGYCRCFAGCDEQWPFDEYADSNVLLAASLPDEWVHKVSTRHIRCPQLRAAAVRLSYRPPSPSAGLFLILLILPNGGRGLLSVMFLLSSIFSVDPAITDYDLPVSHPRGLLQTKLTNPKIKVLY